MNADLERKLLLKEILIFSHALMSDDIGGVLFSTEDLKVLDKEEIEELRALAMRLRDMSRSLGGTRGKG